MQDFVFDCEFHCVWQFESIAAEELDAVVAPGIVRGADDYTSLKAMRARQKGNSRRGHNARALDTRSGLAQTLSQRGRDPHTRLARVAAENDPGFGNGFAQRVPQRNSCGKYRSCVQGRFACNASNAVGAEKFAYVHCAHPLTFSVWAFCSYSSFPRDW